jgi:hypothetical protein
VGCTGVAVLAPATVICITVVVLEGVFFCTCLPWGTNSVNPHGQSIMVQVHYQYDGSAIILFKQINALLSIAAPFCMPILCCIGSVHLLCTAYLSGGCSPHPVHYYTGSVHLLCSAYLLGGYSPHPNLAVARVSITYALSRTSLLQQEGISHLSLLQATQAHLWRESAVVQLHVMVARARRCLTTFGNCAGSWLWSRCLRQAVWLHSAGLAGCLAFLCPAGYAATGGGCR